MRVPLYNFVSNQTVWAAVEDRLLNALRNGERVYKQIRDEVYVHKRQKPTDTIHRRMLPSFSTETQKEQVQVSQSWLTRNSLGQVIFAERIFSRIAKHFN